MKRILIICFFLITKHSYSQLALPFPDSTANWVITECFSGGGAPGAFYCFNYRYFSLGDTSMNGFTYKILNESYNLDPSDTISSSIVGYYRIDGQKFFISRIHHITIVLLACTILFILIQVRKFYCMILECKLETLFH